MTTSYVLAIKNIMQQIKSRLVFATWRDSYLIKPLQEHDPISTDLYKVMNYSSNSGELQFAYSSWTKDENVSDTDTAKRVFQELVLNHQDPRINLIILAADSSGLSIAQKLFTTINER